MSAANAQQWTRANREIAARVSPPEEEIVWLRRRRLQRRRQTPRLRQRLSIGTRTDQPRPKLRRTLAVLLNVNDDELDLALARFGPELKLHAAVDPEMRRAIERGPVTAKAAAAQATPASAAAPNLSRGLRRQMNL